MDKTQVYLRETGHPFCQVFDEMMKGNVGDLNWVYIKSCFLELLGPSKASVKRDHILPIYILSWYILLQERMNQDDFSVTTGPVFFNNIKSISYKASV